MGSLFYVFGCLAGLCYCATVVIAIVGKESALFDSTMRNSIWLLIAIVSIGMGRLIKAADMINDILRRLDGWKGGQGGRIGHKGASALEVLEQIRDKKTGGGV